MGACSGSAFTALQGQGQSVAVDGLGVGPTCGAAGPLGAIVSVIAGLRVTGPSTQGCAVSVGLSTCVGVSVADSVGEPDAASIVASGGADTVWAPATPVRNINTMAMDAQGKVRTIAVGLAG